MSKPSSYALAGFAGVLVALAGAPVSHAQPTPDAPRAEIVAEIARLDSIWLNAYTTADTAAVASILAPDFVGQLHDTMADRADMLARVAAARNVEATILERLVVNVYAEAAVAHAVRTTVRREEGRRTEDRYAYTDVYVYRDGRWVCITGQSAPIASGS